MSQNIRTKIEFQDWDSLTEPTKSLASFFLAHSCLFFRGEYDGDTLSFMSAALFMDNLVSSGASDISYGTKQSYAILGALYGLNRNSSYEESGVVLSLDGVPEVDTNFINTQSSIESFRLWGSYSTDYDPAFEYESDFRKDTDYSNYSYFDLNIPIVFKTIANNEEVEDPFIVPTFIEDKEEDSQGYHVTKFPIDLSLFDLSYSFLFRSSSFTIKYINSNNIEVEKDVFYKIGLWTNTLRYADGGDKRFDYFNLDADGHYDVGEVVDYITDPENDIKLELSLYEEDKIWYNLKIQDDPENYTLSFIPEYSDVSVLITSKYDSSVLNQITKSVILPMYHYYNDDHYPLGFLYLELYNQDGTLFTDSLSGSTQIGVKSSSDSQANFNILEADLSFTDQDMSGGFIPSTAVNGLPVITFGNYPQSSSDPEPIEWYVLEEDTVNNRSLVISKKVLDCQKYNDSDTSITWERCSLRTWLNNTFLNAAFSESEQSRIIHSHIENPNNPDYGTSGGNDTDDYIFCLSIQEASNESYFSDDTVRKAKATQYAIDNGVFDDRGYARWWLRSQGTSVWYASSVENNGEVYSYGFRAIVTYIGVRPVMWISNS